MKSVFGVPVSDLECINEKGVMIPSVLVTLKNYLYNNGGLMKEGIFRQSGSEKEENKVRDLLNKGTFDVCTDIYCVANLIKIWFRELPEPILNCLSKEAILNSEDNIMGLFHTLPSQNKVLFQWLIDLLADVAIYESQNKMNPRTLCKNLN